MADIEIHTQALKIPNGSLQIDAYLAVPSEPGPYPAVIVWQEIFGVNAHIRNVTERIAQLGYVAIAPAIYQRQAPGFEVGYSPEEVELGRQYKIQTTATELLSDAQATIDMLHTLEQVQNDCIASIGFCFGGHVAYLVATLPAIAATAVFYGAGIATLTPGGGPPTLTRTPEIKGTLYGFFGNQDVLIPNPEVDQIRQVLQEAGVEHRITQYPARHGFFCDQRDSYQPTAAADAWQQFQELLAGTFANR
ncbi:Carboxymethylenebutenolidase [Acaryochloris thomasi RCC1774]|uniref:Carboxymethylenebutenolidase n=1 Tax=Acaryochloris thomasi RCC1774 TaxID=1764569 RepID=A0A2W1JCH9_9CYAN|nr:dienelactone hydrolase family protein [Acaryochloris thomasi]PZD71659.1 Carboxymethylenebutenolidase [Acaryochloris thomasi RCC1774]